MIAPAALPGLALSEHTGCSEDFSARTGRRAATAAVWLVRSLTVRRTT
jgi:hypothetical protein